MSFYERSLILIPKPNKGIIQKQYYKVNTFYESRYKSLKIMGNQILIIYRRKYHK
jgi:hypothetical protein